MPSDCNGVSCFQQIFEKNLEFTSEVWVFSLWVLWVLAPWELTASWLPLFVSAKPSRTTLSIDRSEPRFESHTGGKIKKTWKFWRFLLIFG